MSLKHFCHGIEERHSGKGKLELFVFSHNQDCPMNIDITFSMMCDEAGYTADDFNELDKLCSIK